MAGVEIDFAKVLITVIHERAFKNSTTYPCAYLIFYLCRDAEVPIWHCDMIRSLVGTFDIGLMKDKANTKAPHRCIIIEMHPLSENLADTVELAEGADLATSEPFDTTPSDSSYVSNRAQSSSHSTPPSKVLVPLAWV